MEAVAVARAGGRGRAGQGEESIREPRGPTQHRADARRGDMESGGGGRVSGEEGRAARGGRGEVAREAGWE